MRPDRPPRCGRAPRRPRRRRAAALSFAVILGAACTIERTEGGSEPPATAVGAGPGAAAPEAPATPGARSAPTSDTIAGIAPEVVAEVVPAVPVPDDTGAVEATTVELMELRASITIPVQGVTADALHDTYAEARGTRTHQALDILAPRGTPVVSATDGRLLRLHESRAGGRMVYAADATDRFVLMYAHLDSYAPGLTEGMPLRRGQLLGHVGTSGNAPPGTPHLHFAIARGRPGVSWWRGTPVNPYPLLAR